MSQTTRLLEDSLHTMSAAAVELADALDHERSNQRTPDFRPPLGTVQRRIVALGGVARPEGMGVDEIARLANRPGGPSTLIVLDTLCRRGILERLPNDPSRYRLAAPYRHQAALAAGSPPRHRAPSTG